MIALVTMVLAALIVLLVLMVLVFDRRTTPSRGQRLALSMMAAGLLWAGPARLMGGTPGPGDAVFLLGLLSLLAAVYGPGLARKLDAMDGRADGRLGIIPLHRGAIAVGGPGKGGDRKR
jgi:hypothetical protein